MDSVAPVRRGRRFRLESERIAFEVDAELGGRIVEFSLDDRNVLFEGGTDRNSAGSTFWTSPQTAWSWPPPPELDRDPYEVRDVDSRILLASKRSAMLGVSVAKEFAMAPDGVVAIVYTMRNESGVVRSVAPWEVTRVPRAGRTFFPRGTGVRASAAFPAPPSSESDAIVWLEHPSNDDIDRKLLGDGPGGWLAHVDRGVLFLKTFESIPPEAQAPGEALVEVFVSGNAPYVEIEQQGAYESLAPLESLVWRVKWRILKLPEHVRTRADLASVATSLHDPKV